MATGVRLEDGSVITAVQVLSSADPKCSLLRLIEPGVLPTRLAHDVENIDTRGSMARIHLLIDELPQYLPFKDATAGPQHHGHQLLGPSQEAFEEAFEAQRRGTFPSTFVIEAVTQSATDDSLGHSGEDLLGCRLAVNIYACAMHICVPHSRYDHLDELLTRLHVARQRPGWRRRLLDGGNPIARVSTLRALRAVEHRQQSGDRASVGDVAEYMAVEHSTASRTVAAVVAAGLLTKTSATDDQRRCVLVLTDVGSEALAAVTDRRRKVVAETIADWPDEDVDTLIVLLDRLTERFEHVAGA